MSSAGNGEWHPQPPCEVLRRHTTTQAGEIRPVLRLGSQVLLPLVKTVAMLLYLAWLEYGFKCLTREISTGLASAKAVFSNTRFSESNT